MHSIASQHRLFLNTAFHMIITYLLFVDVCVSHSFLNRSSNANSVLRLFIGNVLRVVCDGVDE